MMTLGRTYNRAIAGLRSIQASAICEAGNSRFWATSVKRSMTGLSLAREVGNAQALRRFVKREVMPTALDPAAMDDFICDGVTTIWHQSCTAKMGQDNMSVVDSRLKVYGVDRLRIADASVMPRVPWLTPWLPV